MRLMNMTRADLIELALDRLPRRYRRRMDASAAKAQVIGLFRPDAGAACLGLRFSVPRRPPLYARLFEVRREGGWVVVVLGTKCGFPWRCHCAEGFCGDNPPAYARLWQRAQQTAKPSAVEGK